MSTITVDSDDITTFPSDLSEEPIITNIPTKAQITEQANDSSSDSLPFLMPTPPFAYFIADTITGEESSPIVLNMTSCEPNDITDIDNWFTDNELSMNRNLNSITDAPTDIYFYKFDGADGIDGNISNL